MADTTKSTNIGFINADGVEDQTQFDTWDDTELKELWWDFCVENGIVISTEKIIADYDTGLPVD